MVDYSPVKLLEYIRDGLIEQEHYGFLVKYSTAGFQQWGDSRDYPFFIRSCAKPLQASLLVDYELSNSLSMTSSEIAICCASHTGEKCHVDTAKSLLKKVGVDEKFLKCGFHKPISKTEQEKLVISGEKESIFQNNCSGKHVMMLGLCKKMGWAMDDYDSKTNPLQLAIKKKIYELCELSKEFPDTKDGCGMPIYSMPLKNMAIGYANLFFDKKYEKIKNAFLQNPYLIGGEDRLDTAIMSVNSDLIAKVGAGGLCVVVNLKLKEVLIVKIMDCDMKARAISLISALHRLNWLNKAMLKDDSIKAQNKRDILTLHGDKVGQVEFCIKDI